jgi:hypothetical protein
LRFIEFCIFKLEKLIRGLKIPPDGENAFVVLPSSWLLSYS